MKYKKILITGGAGFVGSNIGLKLKEHYENVEVIALDNLVRRGSELNLSRLKKGGVKFIHGDVRNKEDLNFNSVDLLIECSAEPSVVAGINSSPEYLLNTNLGGAINCFELARRNKVDVIFLSTSRVYPIVKLNDLDFVEEETRFTLKTRQKVKGASGQGISEKFALEGVRSLYGTTKLSAELILQEYVKNYGIRGVINRCGLITGPWQMGKVDQGVIVYWMARHIFKRPLSYIGFSGKGKQVRDILHVNDLFDLLNIQIKQISKFNSQIYNVGGGLANSLSLLELTSYCQQVSGERMRIASVVKVRHSDVRIYISDTTKIKRETGWKPNRNIVRILEEIHQWIIRQKKDLEDVLFSINE